MAGAALARVKEFGHWISNLAEQAERDDPIAAVRQMILDMERSRMDSKDLMKYDASDPTLAYMISNLDYPKFPVPVGVFVDIERASYSDLLEGITNDAKEKAEGPDDLRTLLSGNNTWSIE